MTIIKVIPKLSPEGEVILFYPEVDHWGYMDAFTVKDSHTRIGYEYYQECKLIWGGKNDTKQVLNQLLRVRVALERNLPFKIQIQYIRKARRL